MDRGRREEPVKSMKPMARKVTSPPLDDVPARSQSQ